MSQRVQIIVEAKDSASGVLRGITSQFGSLGSTIEELTGTNINWGNVAMQATQMVVGALKDAVKVTQEYSAQVRDLSLASGVSAEEASRLLQVLDDFELSAQDVTTATKALTKEGFAPTIETIAQLSDQYLQLNTAQERNAFIQKNLGRGGAAWANALSQGGDALRSLNESVDENLVLTEKNISESERYRYALDAWNDRVLALKVSIGNELLPVMTDMLTASDQNARAMQILTESGNEYSLAQLRLGHIQEAGAAAALAQARAEMDAAAAMKSAGDAAAESAPNYASLLSMMEKLNRATSEQIKLAAYQDLKAKLSEGGGITPEESKILEDAGLALGIFDRNAAESARSIDQLNKSLAAGTITLSAYLDLLNQIPTSIVTDISYNIANDPNTTRAPAPPSSTGRAAGGEVYAGMPYLVGENGGESFMPSQNGRILGHAESLHAAGLGGGGGTNYFYGNVTLQIGEDSSDGILGYR